MEKKYDDKTLLTKTLLTGRFNEFIETLDDNEHNNVIRQTNKLFRDIVKILRENQNEYSYNMSNLLAAFKEKGGIPGPINGKEGNIFSFSLNNIDYEELTPYSIIAFDALKNNKLVHCYGITIPNEYLDYSDLLKKDAISCILLVLWDKIEDSINNKFISKENRKNYTLLDITTYFKIYTYRYRYYYDMYKKIIKDIDKIVYYKDFYWHVNKAREIIKEL